MPNFGSGFCIMSYIKDSAFRDQESFFRGNDSAVVQICIDRNTPSHRPNHKCMCLLTRILTVIVAHAQNGNHRQTQLHKHHQFPCTHVRLMHSYRAWVHQRLVHKHYHESSCTQLGNHPERSVSRADSKTAGIEEEGQIVDSLSFFVSIS